jgi:geranylgeranylglycerol-phosphate geranylgeranyltransferase
MCASIIKNKAERLVRSKDPRLEHGESTCPDHKSSINARVTTSSIVFDLFSSQVILFNSRKKWGLLFAVATISGMFCVPTAMEQILNDLSLSSDSAILVLTKGLLPISTLLIITGMYVLNDIFDADLDRISGKTNRPIPSGKVSKRQAFLFVIEMNLIGLIIAAYTSNVLGLLATSIIVLIGILYSIPRISLKNMFIVKTLAISIVMMCSLLAGASIYSYEYLKTDNYGPIDEITYPAISSVSLLFPIFSGTMLFLMVFVTSPLNDLADTEGDKNVGRRTIPLVIGKVNTVKLSVSISLGIAVSTWILFVFLISSSGYNGLNSLVLPSAVSISCFIIIVHLTKVLSHLGDRNFVRESVTKRSMPLHLLLQVSLAIGCSIFY